MIVYDLPARATIDYDLIIQELVVDFHSHFTSRHQDQVCNIDHGSGVTCYYGSSRQISMPNFIQNRFGITCLVRCF